jgi:light-regulated signal transduction histidine kinase (bacteriophytochrome)
MSNLDRHAPQNEIERLRGELEMETQRCLDLQRLLDRADTGFERFVSLAAHSFSESLRQVMSYTQLLAEARPEGADAGDCLGHIRAGAARMQSLVADMVDYWAVDDRPPSPTPMEPVLAHAILAADALIAARGAIVTHDALPLVWGDFGVLANVMRHLLRNAIEYCEAPVPLVHVTARQEDRQWAILVQDNGPGVEPAFQERIFGPFQRLHGRQYPGNGLGLAFCRKAIERLGGRMSMESTPGPGSCFRFTLPAAG